MPSAYTSLESSNKDLKIVFLLEISGKMEVKDFSEKIKLSADKNAKGKRLNRIIIQASSLTGGILSVLTTIDYFGNPLYHASGLATYLTNRITDLYSSCRCSKLAEDKRFKEYGLGEFWGEENPSLSKHPSVHETLFNKNLVTLQIVGGVGSTLLPSLGHSFGFSAPFIYEQNWTISNRIEKAMEIGDEVKEMIEKGLGREEINSYLDSLAKGRKR